MRNGRALPGRIRPPVGAAVTLAAVALAAAACSSGSHGASVASVGAGKGTASVRPTVSLDPLAFAKCMRSHGIANFPDPTRGGLKLPAGVDSTSPQYVSATQACQQYIGGAPQPAQPDQVWTMAEKLQYAQCMRTNGVPDFPDPGADGGFELKTDPNLPWFKKAAGICAKYQPQFLRKMQPNGGPSGH